MKGVLMQLVKVQSEELSIHFGSYLGGGEGDRAVEAPGTMSAQGGLASVWAATRVKSEQASKGLMEMLSQLRNGEGRRDESEQSTNEDSSVSRGNGRSTHTHINTQHGRPVGVLIEQRFHGGRRRQESEEPIVPSRPGNAGGGKGLWFGVRPDEPKAWRLA